MNKLICKHLINRKNKNYENKIYTDLYKISINEYRKAYETKKAKAHRLLCNCFLSENNEAI